MMNSGSGEGSEVGVIVGVGVIRVVEGIVRGWT